MRRKFGIVIAILLLSICLCLAGYSGYQLYQFREACAEEDKTCEHIAQQAASQEPSPEEEPQERELADGITWETRQNLASTGGYEFVEAR
jgi:hypothetical protein